MASTFYAMSTFGAVASPGNFGTDKKLASRQKLSSLASISPSLLISNRRHSCSSLRSGNSKINAMAKELYFNKDGSAIKKLQVCYGNSKHFFPVCISLIPSFFVLFLILHYCVIRLA